MILADFHVSNMHGTVARRQLLKGISCLGSVIQLGVAEYVEIMLDTGAWTVYPTGRLSCLEFIAYIY
jgi:hypothetical protein